MSPIWWSGTQGARPVFLRDVASVSDGPLPPSRYIWYASAGKDGAAPAEFPAVTISISKKPGENAIDVADAVTRRVQALHNAVIPADVRVAETRNATMARPANDKARNLIQ
jgi:multidrug efflux pump subunit AcrB